MDVLVLLPGSVLLGSFAMLGLALGSFGNVLIHRLPSGESILRRSHCPRCAALLSWQELVPLVSFLVQQGRCRHCRRSISFLYPLVEAGMAALFALALVTADYSVVDGFFLALALGTLLLVAVIDTRTRTVPDVLNGALLLFALAHRAFIQNVDLSGALLGGGFLGLQWAVSRGRFVGSGDIFLAVAVGVLLGSWQLTLLGIALAYMVGAVVVSGLLLTRCIRGHVVAFGPFLALGALLVMVWGGELLHFLRL